MPGQVAPPLSPANLCGVWPREGPNAPREGRGRPRGARQAAPGTLSRVALSPPDPESRGPARASARGAGTRDLSGRTAAGGQYPEDTLYGANRSGCAHQQQNLDARALRLFGAQPRLAPPGEGHACPDARGPAGAPRPPARAPFPPLAAPALTGRGSSRRPAAGAEGSRRLLAPSPRAGSPGSRCAARRPRPHAGESRPCGARTPGSGSWRERPAGGQPAPAEGTSASRAGGCAESPRAGVRLAAGRPLRPAPRWGGGRGRLRFRALRAAPRPAGGEVTTQGPPGDLA